MVVKDSDFFLPLLDHQAPVLLAYSSLTLINTNQVSSILKAPMDMCSRL